MNPGPELDQRIAELIGDVAEHVWRFIATEGGERGYECCHHYACIRCGDEQEVEREVDLPTGPCYLPFSENWTATMLAAENRCRAVFPTGLTLHLSSDPSQKRFHAEFVSNMTNEAVGEGSSDVSGPHAVCLAILDLPREHK